MKMKDPRQENPLEEGVRELANAGRALASGIKSLFSSKKETKIVESTFSYVGNVFVDDTIALNADSFNTLYNQVPESLCKTYNDMLVRFRMSLPYCDDSSTYEEILKLHMDLAADASVLGKVDTINGLINFFTKISIPMPSIQTIGLSLVWANMIYELESKHSSSPLDSEKNRIAKMCIGLLGFVSQVSHREIPIWNWIGTVYKSFATAGDYIKESPYLYRKIFPDKYIDIKKFPNWHKNLENFISRNESVTIGQAFNICYTFRVGDIYLYSVLNSSSYFNDDLKNRLIDALSPVPKERDLMRIFELYTKPSIY